MVLPLAFRERLEQMEQTLIQRLSLLQAEKDIQISKSRVLASKLSNIRSKEQRCLKLDSKIASQHLIVSSLYSQLHNLESIYSNFFQQLRDLKNVVIELEELEKEKLNYYLSQSQEMEDFKAEVEVYVVNCCGQLEELKVHANKLKSSFSKLQNSVSYSNSSEIAAAETKKAKLLSEKGSLDRILASNIQRKEQLRKQLHSILAEQAQQTKK